MIAQHPRNGKGFPLRPHAAVSNVSTYTPLLQKHPLPPVAASASASVVPILLHATAPAVLITSVWLLGLHLLAARGAISLQDPATLYCAIDVSLITVFAVLAFTAIRSTVIAAGGIPVDPVEAVAAVRVLDACAVFARARCAVDALWSVRMMVTGDPEVFTGGNIAMSLILDPAVTFFVLGGIAEAKDWILCRWFDDDSDATGNKRQVFDF
ncbi:hypothetical protein HDU83_001375 [Entophlyctis luteolus]|nr:hypothetical protein HDU83_001375 [Entophlyctis luteolus]